MREVIYNDPQGDYVPTLNWVQVSNSITTGANVSGGNVYVVQPRWSYDGVMFRPPPPPIPLPKPSGQATYVDKFSFTGQGSNVWTEIGNVGIFADLKTVHFINYSLDIFDASLVAYTPQNTPPNGNTNGGTGYGPNSGGGGSETAGNAGDAAQAAQAALDVLGAVAASVAGQDGETGGSPDIAGGGTDAGAGASGKCFIATTQITMGDGQLKAISDISPGEMIKTDTNETVSVVNVLVDKGNFNLVSVNNTESFVTDDHVVLTEKGWGTVNPTGLAAKNPGSYQTVLQDNGYRPLVQIQQGVSIAFWKNNQISYEPIGQISVTPHRDITVYYLVLEKSNNYIANNIVVHS